MLVALAAMLKVTSNYSRIWFGYWVLFGALGLFISQLIVRPIEDVSAASQRIAAGHYEERLPVSTDDELGDLMGNFNLMAEALDQTETMRQQLLGDFKSSFIQ